MLSMVSIVTLPSETSRIHVLPSLVPFFKKIHIVNHQNCLLTNKQYSQEGTTQGNTLAMSLYGIAIIALTELLDDCFTVQKWYADNGNAFGCLDDHKNFLIC